MYIDLTRAGMRRSAWRCRAWQISHLLSQASGDVAMGHGSIRIDRRLCAKKRPVSQVACVGV